MYKNPTKTVLLGNTIVYLPSCHSTNSKAAEIMQKKNIEEGTVFITDDQFSGRGQRGNLWESEPGKNYTFSIVLKPSFLNLEQHFYLNIIVSLGILKFLNCHQKGFHIKWPNDIYHKGRKIAGILIENSIRGNEFQHSIIGIGLNINQTEFLNQKPTSLSIITGESIDLKDSLEQLLLDLEYFYLLLKRGELSNLKNMYLKQMMWINEKHHFQSTSKFEGVIKGINELGQLIIDSNGDRTLFNFKEVEFIQ